MATYIVIWTIDILDADTPEEAARLALAMQRDNESIATVFEVKNRDTARETVVNLAEGEGDR